MKVTKAIASVETWEGNAKNKVKTTPGGQTLEFRDDCHLFR